MPSEDVNRLPKWAQWKIQKLEQDLQQAESKLSAFSGERKSRITVDPDAVYIGSQPTYLHDGASIEFVLPGGDVEIELRDNHLHITSQGAGNLVVRPSCSNVIELYLVPDGVIRGGL